MFLLFGLGHMKEHCQKKNGKGPIASTNYLEVMVDDEKVTLAKLNQFYGVKNNVFFGTKVPEKRIQW